jgi:hypothetical protein
MMKKKVCHFSTRYIMLIVLRLLDRQCKKLSKAGYEVTLIALHEKKQENIENVKIISFPKQLQEFIE